MPPQGKLRMRILTPGREVLSTDVDAATLTAEGGELGILPGHAALLAKLRPGIASFREGGQTHVYALSEGFLEVQGDIVTALVRTAESSRDIDVARAEKRRAEREAELKRANLDELQTKCAELSLQKQLARLQAASRAVSAQT